MKTIATVLLLATSCMAVAGEGGGHKPPPDPSVTVKQNVKIDSHNTNTHVNTNTATSNANSKSNSQSNSESNSTSNSNSASAAFGGDSTASGGAASVVTNYPQQAPSVAQGSFAIQGCGVAGNLGGSNTHGAGFLGFGFTPDECYRLMLAQAYQAVGQTEAACEVLNRTDMALDLERKRGMPLPVCHTGVVVVAPPPQAEKVCATEEQVNAVEQKCKATVQK